MKLEVLVSTMYKNDHEILKKMNIKTDVVVINQSQDNNIKCFERDGKLVRFISLKEVGVGLSRNTALMRAKGDICLFADEDCIYKNNYEKMVLEVFSRFPDADVIFFNIESLNPNRPIYQVKKTKRIYWYNSLKYGAARIAIKRKSIIRERIFFSLMFGGGTKYGAGEDSLFITDCLKAGLKIYASKECIGIVEQKESSWFQGYDNKYFFDRGALFVAISRRYYIFLILQFLLRHRDLFKNKNSFLKLLNIMIKGAKDYKNN